MSQLPLADNTYTEIDLLGILGFKNVKMGKSWILESIKKYYY